MNLDYMGSINIFKLFGYRLTSKQHAVDKPSDVTILKTLGIEPVATGREALNATQTVLCGPPQAHRVC